MIICKDLLSGQVDQHAFTQHVLLVPASRSIKSKASLGKTPLSIYPIIKTLQ